ncbi:hypothetical protein ACFL59_07090 [Planctomycetota bacterium]
MRLSNKRWNQGNVDQNPFAMQRQQATHRVQIDAPAMWLFERACLAGQPGWLPAGSMQLSYSESGKDELNALWSENETGPALFQKPGLRTFWTTTLLDPVRCRYEAVLVAPELAMGTLNVEMAEQDGGTAVRFDLSYTVISESGSALFDEVIGDRLGQLLERFGRNLTSSLSAGTASEVRLATHKARRRAVEHETTIDGDVDECFALACPVAELLWIDDWHFDLVYSESGRNEEGCIFLEPASGLSILRSPGANTYWYTTRFDTDEHRFEAIWLTRDVTIARWELSMTDLGGGRTRVNWSLVYTGLCPEGSRVIGESDFAERMKRVLSFLAASLKHYVETGTCLRITKRRKLQLAASLIGTALGRHFRRRRTCDGSASAPSR